MWRDGYSGVISVLELWFFSMNSLFAFINDLLALIPRLNAWRESKINKNKSKKRGREKGGKLIHSSRAMKSPYP